jgi:hypothetical protein
MIKHAIQCKRSFFVLPSLLSASGWAARPVAPSGVLPHRGTPSIPRPGSTVLTIFSFVSNTIVWQTPDSLVENGPFMI